MRKNPGLTVNKVRHWSIAYRTFSAQVKVATQVDLCKYIVFSAKKNEEKIDRASNFCLIYADYSFYHVYFAPKSTVDSQNVEIREFGHAKKSSL